MGKAAEALDLDGEELDALDEVKRRRRARKEESERPAREEIKRADDNVRTGAAAHRLLRYVTGQEKPSRESMDDYVKRKGL